MKKLKNKILWVIISILTIFLLTILCIFNFQSYKNEVKNIKQNLTRMDNKKIEPPQIEQNEIEPKEQIEDNQTSNDSKEEINEKENVENKEQNTNVEDNEKQENNEPEPKIFMDTILYTVLIDNNKNIIDVINHTPDSADNETIKQIAQDIIDNSNGNDTKIGNLYFEKYSYSINQNSIIIIDNSIPQEKLISLLKTSIIIFVLLEIVIIYVSILITKWIIKPVEESFKKQKEFIADASHELKTPLSVIIANAEALENEPEEKKWLNNIKSEGERMNGLISDLLNMAEIENEKPQENFKEENLSKAVENVVLTFESLIFERNIQLNYKITENIKLECNGNQIKQVVAILIDNAIKHCEKEGKININLYKEKNNIILEVQNTGEEIPKEEQNKIFERFYRADKSRNRNENRYGLGLAIAKTIVEKHNGKIEVKSEKRLTTFKVVLK